jgi:hypothetical protein
VTVIGLLYFSPWLTVTRPPHGLSVSVHRSKGTTAP